MKIIFFPFVLGFVCSNILGLCDGQRTKDKMYEPIDGISSCFRRMNGTHQTGCSSSREGSTGVVHVINSEKDLEKILKADNGLKYIPVLPVYLFTKNITEELQRAEQISGLVVYGDEKTGQLFYLDEKITVEKERTSLSYGNGSIKQKYYSHEDTCPNRYSNLEGTCDNDWNEFGTGILQMDFRFPVFYINKNDHVEKIKDCYQKFNSFDFAGQPSRSLCSLELEGFMFASIDTPTCIRRSGSSFNLNPVKFCDPLGDQNVWGSLFPMGNSSLTPNMNIGSNTKYIILAARLDTTSLFHELVPGANNPVTGLVTLLTTAMKLKIMIPKFDGQDTNILFVLFHGESYDYIGSQRFVYDMEHGEFPTPDYKGETEAISSIKPEDIELFIEINQMSKTDKIHIYSMEKKIPDFVNILRKRNESIFQWEAQANIPPSSYQSFHKANYTIPGVILTDHGKHYSNVYYNSLFDDSANINFTYVNVSEKSDYHSPPGSIQEHINDVSSELAKSLYEIINKKEYIAREDIEAGYMVNELLHCYLENANCLVHQAIQRKEFNEEPLSLYVGVTAAPNILTSLIGLTLAWLTGSKISSEDCVGSMHSYVYRHFNMSESIYNLNTTNCFRASMNLTDAESPAFIIEDYDWKSGKYSTWSESIWRDFSVRLFLKPSRAHEYMTFAVGSVVFVISILLVIFVNRKSEVLFETTGSISPASC